SSVPPPTADDNLVTKRSQVKANIDTIKEKKQKILAALKQLKESETPDKETMALLVKAYDGLAEQETQYMMILTNIVEIHEKATEDVATEIKERLEREKVRGRGERRQELTTHRLLIFLVQIESTLREISEMQAAAVAASLVNDQLVAKLGLSKTKHLAMKQRRDDATSVQSEDARVVLEEREKAKLEVAAERQAMEKKRKELEKLRKSVMKKECEGGEETNEEVEVDESARVPALLSAEEEEKERKRVSQADEEREKTLEERRAEIRARVDAERKRREGVAQQISERLAAMNKRKERMNEIGRILSGIKQQEEEREEAKQRAKTEEDKEEKEEAEAERTRKEIELNLAAASMSLKHLTEMRERLEALQARGEEPSEADEAMMRRLEEADGAEFVHCCPHCGRQQVDGPSRKHTLSRQEAVVAPSYADGPLARQLSDRLAASEMDTVSSRRRMEGQLTRIEETLAAQRTQLTILVRRGDRDEDSNMSRQLHCLLLSSSPRVLSGLSSICTDLARGKAVPNLERVLERLLDPRDITRSSLSTTLDHDDDLIYENRSTQEASSSTEEAVSRKDSRRTDDGSIEDRDEREDLTVERVVEAIQGQCKQVIEGEEVIDERLKQR
ncbi:hypothetical protein PFISCL1PPCAC_8911, partial [Pristionchus fissidentatus]